MFSPLSAHCFGFIALNFTVLFHSYQQSFQPQQAAVFSETDPESQYGLGTCLAAKLIVALVNLLEHLVSKEPDFSLRKWWGATHCYKRVDVDDER